MHGICFSYLTRDSPKPSQAVLDDGNEGLIVVISFCFAVYYHSLHHGFLINLTLGDGLLDSLFRVRRSQIPVKQL